MPSDPSPWQAPIPSQSSTGRTVRPGTGHWPDEKPLVSSRLLALSATVALIILMPVSLFCLGGGASILVVVAQNPDILSGGLDPNILITGELLFASFFFGFGSLAVLGTSLALLIGWRPRHALGLRMPGLGMIAVAIIGGLVVGLFPGWVAHQIIEAFPDLANQGTLDAIERVLTSGPWLSRGLAILTVVIGAPILEEICFRGVLWNALERLAPGIGGQGIALVVTSLAFAIAHADLVQSSALIPTAFFLGWLRMTSGSLWPCILAHFVNNTLATVIGLYSAQLDADDLSPSLLIAISGLILTLVLTLAAVALRRRPLATPESAWSPAPEP